MAKFTDSPAMPAVKYLMGRRLERFVVDISQAMIDAIPAALPPWELHAEVFQEDWR
jgi:hypothetical protein